MTANATWSHVDLVRRLRAAGCVFAEDEATLLLDAAGSAAELAGMVERRAAGVPLEVILGWAQFCGLRISIEPGVFVPRRRTELLVREALTVLTADRPWVDRDPIPHSGAGRRGRPADADPGRARPEPADPGRPGPVIVDLCCGSGAIGAALAASLGRVRLHAVDIDPIAARCAARNLAAAGGRVYLGDLYRPLPGSLRGRVDLVVANAPYVPTEAIELMPTEARVHEPRVALDGGPDGLLVQSRAIEGAPQWLAPGGSLLVETSAEQGARTLGLVTGAGLTARLVSDDELDATVVIASRPAATGP